MRAYKKFYIKKKDWYAADENIKEATLNSFVGVSFIFKDISLLKSKITGCGILKNKRNYNEKRGFLLHSRKHYIHQFEFKSIL